MIENHFSLVDGVQGARPGSTNTHCVGIAASCQRLRVLVQRQVSVGASLVRRPGSSFVSGVVSCTLVSIVLRVKRTSWLLAHSEHINRCVLRLLTQVRLGNVYLLWVRDWFLLVNCWKISVVSNLVAKSNHRLLFGNWLHEAALLDGALSEVALSENLVQNRCISNRCVHWLIVPLRSFVCFHAVFKAH